MHYWRELPNGEKVERSWLMYSKSQNVVYCFCCKLFQPDSTSSTLASGTKDWKNLARNLASHERASYHREAFCSWKNLEVKLRLKAATDDDNQAKSTSEIHHWQNALKRLVAIVKVLAGQNLALHGISEQLYVPNNGHFLKLVEMIGEFDSELEAHLRRIHTQEVRNPFLGKTIQNEIVQLLATQIKQKILALLKSAKYYSIILDCTPDGSHAEQMTLMVRFVTSAASSVSGPAAVDVREHFLGFIDIDTAGPGMTNVLLQKLEEMGIDLVEMRGQGYDHGANVKAKNSGVQARLRELNPRAFFLPCHSHSLSLVVSDAASACVEASECFNVIQSIFVFFSASACRWQILEQHLGTFPLAMKTPSVERWESCMEAVKAIRNQLGEVDDAIVAVMEDGALTGAAYSKTKAEGKGIASKMGNFQFLCGLVVWHDILSEISVASKSLQGVDHHLSMTIQQLEKTKSFLQCYRSDEGFESVLQNARELAEELDVDAAFPPVWEVGSRHRRRYFDYEAQGGPITDPEQYFKVEFFHQVLDGTIQLVEEHLQQLKEHHRIFGVLYNLPKLEETPLDVLCQHCVELEKALSHGDSHDIDAADLYGELRLLPASRCVSADSAPKDVLKCICANKLVSSFPNLCVALRILLTLPVMAADGECSFSKLHLVKAHLHSEVARDRLPGLATVSIEHEVAQTLDLKQVVRVLAAKFPS
ncbi:zinc finger MYM-type protein 1-like isoform X2 [Hemicordylus capensis]|nr:zinc finger MYM-type protein 1-like isoform X2 [Hemicordylus capensis]